MSYAPYQLDPELAAIIDDIDLKQLLEVSLEIAAQTFAQYSFLKQLMLTEIDDQRLAMIQEEIYLMEAQLDDQLTAVEALSTFFPESLPENH